MLNPAETICQDPATCCCERHTRERELEHKQAKANTLRVFLASQFRTDQFTDFSVHFDEYTGRMSVDVDSWAPPEMLAEVFETAAREIRKVFP